MSNFHRSRAVGVWSRRGIHDGIEASFPWKTASKVEAGLICTLFPVCWFCLDLRAVHRSAFNLCLPRWIVHRNLQSQHDVGTQDQHLTPVCAWCQTAQITRRWVTTSSPGVGWEETHGEFKAKSMPLPDNHVHAHMSRVLCTL